MNRRMTKYFKRIRQNEINILKDSEWKHKKNKIDRLLLNKKDIIEIPEQYMDVAISDKKLIDLFGELQQTPTIYDNI